LAQRWKGGGPNEQIPTIVMMTPTEFHSMLKRRAKRLLLKGDVERYLSTLRELYELRIAQRRITA
jgi:hypothetical protein